MEYVGIITILALLQYFYFGFQVGSHRQRTKEAAVDGQTDLDLKRANRTHLNTLEFLIIFLPMMYLCAYFWNPKIAAALGVLWLVGRFMYRAGYMKDGSSRFPGFMVANLSVLLLMLGALYGIGLNLFR